MSTKESSSKYPRGKLNKHDEGQVAMAIGTEGNTVIISFPKTIKWIGLDPDLALEMAKTLTNHALALKGRKLQ